MSFKIILYALLAAFVLYRLWSVLGKRIGHEETPPARDPFENKNNVVSLKTSQKMDQTADIDEEKQHWSDLSLSEEVRSGLSAIRQADPNFSVIPFISGAKMAFEMIIEGFVGNDKDKLRPLLNDEVYQNYANAIDLREMTGETLDISIQSIRNVEILEAKLEKKTALVTVRFSSQQKIKSTDRDGKILSMSEDEGEQLTDIWVFARTVSSRDPNWIVIATLDEEEV